jgi:BirA family biotin operon repressor/biotin-[acetyl-CoA-carboxylase] ligase
MLSKKKLLAILPIGDFGRVLHFHKRIGSTNDEAKKLAREGAAHGTLIVADEQTEGRGRAGRRWLTPPGGAIAMSVILRPDSIPPALIGELTVLGALATVEALERLGAHAMIKWPNDVLVSDGKAAGVLVEGGWVEERLIYVVMGIGVNVRRNSIKSKGLFDFPAACLEDEMGDDIDRLQVIRGILEALSDRYDKLGSGAFMDEWDRYLAYKGQVVNVQGGQMNTTGKLVGLSERGQLRLQLLTGEVLKIGVGMQQLRPVDRS